jgi:O-antigen/teichoic acid export membrane protein
MESKWKGKSLIRLALSVFSTNIAVLVINLLTGILINRTIGVIGRGQLMTLQVWPLLITTIFSGGFNAAAVHFSANNSGENKKYFGGVVLISLLVGLLAIVTGGSLAAWKLPLSQKELNIVFLAFLVTPLMVLCELTTGMLNGIGQIGKGNQARLLRVLSTLIGLVILRLTHTMTVSNIFWVTYLPGMIALVPNLIALYKADMLHVGDIRLTLRVWLPYAWAGFIVTLLQTAYLRCDQFLMTIYMGDKERGLYGNAVTFSELLQQVPLAISAIIFTSSSFEGQSDRDKLTACARLIRVGLFSNIVFGLMGMILLPHFLYRAYRPEFVGAAPLFNLLLPGAIAMAIGYPIHTFYLGIKRPWVSVIPQIIAVVVTLIGIYYSLKIKSLEAFCLAASAGYIAYCLGMIWYIRRDYGTAATLSLFPSPNMVRSGWSRLREVVRRRLPVA